MQPEGSDGSNAFFYRVETPIRGQENVWLDELFYVTFFVYFLYHFFSCLCSSSDDRLCVNGYVTELAPTRELSS